jgi:quinol monooxygenase YgiN
MFIQVIQAKSSKRDEVRALMQEWDAATDNEASGFLGATNGFTDDGTFIGVVRFESKEKAMANSARPETDAMAKRLAELMDGPPEFHDCEDVTVWRDGGSDDAGFVQVIQGRTDDPERLKEVMAADADDMRAQRPDIIGGTFALEADGSFTNTVAFTDEASAREGESKGGPPEEIQSLMQDLKFYDLHDPWFTSA